MNSFKMEKNRLPEFLKSIKDRHSFAVPAGYFEQFYSRLLQKLDFQNTDEECAAVGTPEDYCSEFSGGLLARIENETITSLGIPRHQGFKVPSAYFENNPEKIVRRVRRAARWRKALYWAVAACLGLGLGAGVVMHLHQSFRTEASPWLAGVSEEELLEYVQSHLDEFETFAIEEILEYDEADDFAPVLDGYSEEDVNVIINDL